MNEDTNTNEVPEGDLFKQRRGNPVLGAGALGPVVESVKGYEWPGAQSDSVKRKRKHTLVFYPTRLTISTC